MSFNESVENWVNEYLGHNTESTFEQTKDFIKTSYASYYPHSLISGKVDIVEKQITFPLLKLYNTEEVYNFSKKIHNLIKSEINNDFLGIDINIIKIDSTQITLLISILSEETLVNSRSINCNYNTSETYFATTGNYIDDGSGVPPFPCDNSDGLILLEDNFNLNDCYIDNIQLPCETPTPNPSNTYTYITAPVNVATNYVYSAGVSSCLITPYQEDYCTYLINNGSEPYPYKLWFDDGQNQDGDDNLCLDGSTMNYLQESLAELAELLRDNNEYGLNSNYNILSVDIGVRIWPSPTAGHEVQYTYYTCKPKFIQW